MLRKELTLGFDRIVGTAVMANFMTLIAVQFSNIERQWLNPLPSQMSGSLLNDWQVHAQVVVVIIWLVMVRNWVYKFRICTTIRFYNEIFVDFRIHTCVCLHDPLTCTLARETITSHLPHEQVLMCKLMACCSRLPVCNSHYPIALPSKSGCPWQLV